MSGSLLRWCSALGPGVACVLLSMAPMAVHGQEGRPVLGGHRFIWNPQAETPFPQTHVRNLTGGGKFSDVEFVPSFDLGGGTVVPAVLGDVLFAELEFEYMHRVQPWLGVWARFGGVGRVGSDAGALLAQGITAVFGYDLGWLFRLHGGESFVLSGIAAVSNDGVTDVDLLRWARGIVSGEQEPLVSSGPRLRGRTGLRAAWGINPSWGMKFKSEAGYGESSGLGSDLIWLWDHAISVSYDLDATTSVPIGFVLSGSTRSSPRETLSDVGSRDVGLRTAFTGREDFLLALDTSWNGVRLPDGDDVGLVRAGLSLQLFF